MEIFLLLCLMVILSVRWFHLRNRFEEIDDRLNVLSTTVGGMLRAAHSTAAEPTAPPAPAAAPPPPPPPVHKPEVWKPMIPPVRVTTPSPEPEVRVTPTPAPPPRPVPPPPSFTTPATPQRTSAEWEALLGGNWLNKIGVFILVVGISLALAYSYKLLGPVGRVSVSLAISLAMLLGGVWWERSERYRTFARGLIGGGWAAIYFTVYAMQALDAARVIYNAWAGAFLLIAVATGMIVHSLRYRSQTVTGLAYFIAFATLAITQVTALSLFALVPLAASLLYIAQRFQWSRMALFGLIGTYAVCATRPDTGAPLWQAQTIFTIYWLLFEAFDILCADPWLLPLNAIGFLGLSIFKWHEVAPQQLWQFLAATSLAYLAGAILRGGAGRWQAPIGLTAALAAVAMYLKLDHQWLALGLLLEAEVFYLAGVRLRSGYLRILAGVLFSAEVVHLLAFEVGQVPVRQWTPIAALSALAFYVNRALRSDDVFYGFAGAGMMALVANFETPKPYRATVWMLLAVAPFALGWWRRLPDFRLQGYLLTLLGLTGAALDLSRLSLSVAASWSYGLTLCALLSGEDRFDEWERKVVQLAGSVAAAVATATLIWKVVPAEYLGLSWMVMALLLLELGLRGLPKYFCRQAYALAAAGAALNYGPWHHGWIPAVAALLAYAMAARARHEEKGAVLAVASVVGSGFAMAAMWTLLPLYAVAPCWMVLALALAEFDVPALRWQTYGVSLAALGTAMVWNLDAPHRVPALGGIMLAHYYLGWRTRQRFYLYTAAALMVVLIRSDIPRSYEAAALAAYGMALLGTGLRWKIIDLRWQNYVLAAMAFADCWYLGLHDAFVVIPCLYAAQFLSERGSETRLYYSLLGTGLTSLLPYYRVADSLRTVVWGIEGMVLLGSGFPLRDRVLRFSGLTILLGCILKLFVWDLRHLETLPRILPFIVLGLFLVGVSWIYTRFRERVARYL